MRSTRGIWLGGALTSPLHRILCAKSIHGDSETTASCGVTTRGDYDCDAALSLF